jgi:hypothetical protein
MNKIAKNKNLEGVARGRPKGSPNKTTSIAKDAIAKAADELGGADRLIEWIKEEPINERIFWKDIYTKLLPLQVNGSGEDGSFITKMVIELVEPK